MNSQYYNLSRDLRTGQLLQSEQGLKAFTMEMTAQCLQKTTQLNQSAGSWLKHN